MKATILDKEGFKLKALNALGIQANKLDIELILNVFQLVDQKGGDITLKDVQEMSGLVYGLFND